MSSLITEVLKGSLAERAGIGPGMSIKSINGHKIKDVLDYKFYIYDPDVEIALDDGAGGTKTVKIEKDEGEDLGLTFETYLMDSEKRCSNRCIFCFIDQLPPNMRETLYFKDDDARMSFLIGNYVSLTNLSEKDAQRIIDMRISPINVSVHTTNPELRSFMLGNRRGGESLKILSRFCEAGLEINAQIVVCPGVNDGNELVRTLGDLRRMYPSVKSVSVVPVGITRHRNGLYPLVPVDAERAAEIIDITDKMGSQCKKDFGLRVFYCSDELYIKAGRVIPEPGYYEDYPQLENGVGMLALLKDEFLYELEYAQRPNGKRRLSIATGCAAAPYIRQLADLLCQRFDNVSCEVYAVKNLLFGETVDVAGLLCGEDILAALAGKDLGSEILIPDCMLRHQTDIFLDDMTLPELEEKLGVSIRPVESSGGSLIKAMLGRC